LALSASFFIGLSFVSLVGFISLIDHIGLVGRIDHNVLVGVIGLSLISLVGIVGLIGFGLIRFGLISFIGIGNLSITSIFGSSASLAHHLLILFILVGLSNNWPFKQAAHGVAIKLTSVTEITKVIISYSLALLHTHSFVRETMWCGSLSPRKRCVGGLPLLAFPTMVTCYNTQNI
jgi:hypothetical protein